MESVTKHDTSSLKLQGPGACVRLGSEAGEREAAREKRKTCNLQRRHASSTCAESQTCV